MTCSRLRCRRVVDGNGVVVVVVTIIALLLVVMRPAPSITPPRCVDVDSTKEDDVGSSHGKVIDGTGSEVEAILGGNTVQPPRISTSCGEDVV